MYISNHDIEEALTLGDKIVIFTEKPARIKKSIKNDYLLNGGEKIN